METKFSLYQNTENHLLDLNISLRTVEWSGME
jgi:hypothetical protein